jgi:hypothetical protein
MASNLLSFIRDWVVSKTSRKQQIVITLKALIIYEILGSDCGIVIKIFCDMTPCSL